MVVHHFADHVLDALVVGIVFIGVGQVVFHDGRFGEEQGRVVPVPRFGLVRVGRS